MIWLIACAEPGTDTGGALAPVIHSVTLSPESPDTNSVMTASVELTAGPGVEVHHRWFADGELTGDYGETLDGALWFRAGQAITVEVTAADDAGESAPVTSAPVVVVNSPPAVTVVVTPDAPMAGVDTLMCTADPTDPDDDPLEVSYAWSDGDSVVSTEPSFVPGAAGAWTCTVGVDDGQAAVSASASVVVEAATVAALDPWVEPETWIDPPVFTAGASVTVRHASASASTVTLRYGFDGWVRVGELAQESLTDNEGQSVWWTDVPMVEVSDGRWEVAVVVPDGCVAMHAELVVDGVVEDNGGRQWHASAVFPFVAPYLSWTDTVGPLDGVVVSWEADVPSFGVVEYGATEALGSYAVGDTWDTLHHVPITGLPEGARVWYRVHDNAGNVSDTYSFLTLAPGETDLTFLVAADMQDNAALTDRWPEVATAMGEMAPDARFVIVPGDLASTDRPGHWWRYFYDGRDLFPNLPMMPVPGNHDTRIEQDPADFASFTTWFELPGEEVYYSFDYGNLRMLGFNTEVDEELLYAGAQYLWAESVLATAYSGWVFGYQHYSPFTVNLIPPNGTLDLQTVTTLFDGRLDFHFGAHNHLHERYLPLREGGALAPSGDYGRDAEDGVGFMVVPSAGDHLWEGILTSAEDEEGLLDKIAFPAFDRSSGHADGEHGWVQVSASATSLRIDTWQMGDDEVAKAPYIADSVTITR